MSNINTISFIALLALMSGPVLAETDDQSTPNEKPKRVQTFGDLLDPDLPGVLTPKGSFVLDTSFSFTQNSSNTVRVVGYTVLPALIVGLIEASDIDRTTLTFGITGRYGITNRLEVEARIPWVYRYDSVLRRSENGEGVDAPSTQTFSDSNLGDIEAAFKYQINMESAPYWIAGLRFKSTTGKSPFEISGDELSTGSGFPSIEPNLTMIMPLDPAVLYANFSYIWNIEDNITFSTDDGQSISGDIDLGDTLGFSAGMGFSVNPKFSFSLGLSHKTILKTKSSIPGQDANAKLLQLSSMSMGANYAINPETTLNVGISAGLTADAPDFQLTVRVPYTLK